MQPHYSYTAYPASHTVQPARPYDPYQTIRQLPAAPASHNMADAVRYPMAYAEPVRMTGRQRMASILFLSTMIGLIACGIYLFVGFLGFDSISQLYGFEHVIETFNVEPPPQL